MHTDTTKTSQPLRSVVFYVLSFIAILWLIKLFELTTNISLVQLGIYPLHAFGLPGLLFAPLIHGSIGHLIANSGPILFLGSALVYGYPKSAKIVIPIIYLGSGLAVWLFARESYHIGASGLAFGLMFFIFTIGALRWDKRAIALSMAVFLLYGGMFSGLLPADASISYESHLSGAIIGILFAFILKNHDPAPPKKVYSWELEDDVIDLEQSEYSQVEQDYEKE